MPRPVRALFRSAASAGHDTGPGHPERPARTAAIEAELVGRDWLGYDVRQSGAASDDQLMAVHPPDYVEDLRALAAAGGGQLDPDTVVSTGSFAAAAHGAGGACDLVDALLVERVDTGASIHRPPGHHAEAARAMGFCLFNAVAVAVRHAQQAHGISRVLVVDWDVHHGNGTNDIFHADPTVLFCSLHQMPLYPGTGPAQDAGSGAGTGYTVNLPVPPGTGDAGFCSLVEHVVVPLCEAFAPGLVLISAGFDAHAADPLAGCAVTDDGYATMGAALRRAADGAGAPLGVVLEGGYDLGALAHGMAATLEAVADPGAVASRDRTPPEPDPLAVAARRRLAPHWPTLGGS